MSRIYSKFVDFIESNFEPFQLLNNLKRMLKNYLKCPLFDWIKITTPIWVDLWQMLAPFQSLKWPEQKFSNLSEMSLMTRRPSFDCFISYSQSDKFQWNFKLFTLFHPRSNSKVKFSTPLPYKNITQKSLNSYLKRGIWVTSLLVCLFDGLCCGLQSTL